MKRIFLCLLIGLSFPTLRCQTPDFPLAIESVLFLPASAEEEVDEAYCSWNNLMCLLIYIRKQQKMETLVKVIHHYEQGRYEQARKAVVAFIEFFGGEDLELQFYLALSLFQQSEYGKAIPYLTALSQEPNFENREQAKWYLALAFIQADIVDGKIRAKALLEEIQQEGGAFAAEARFQLSVAF